MVQTFHAGDLLGLAQEGVHWMVGLVAMLLAMKARLVKVEIVS